MGSTAAPEGALGYVREFTRHSSDVLSNLNELRLRGILTDVTLLVGGQPLRAHKAVLIACSGFFYSIFRGRAGLGVDVLSLPGGPEARGFAPLLDFMYTSRLRLSPATAPAVLAAATYLQMEHVVQACHRFIQASYEPLGISLRPVEVEPPRPPTVAPPGSPRRSEGHPDPPTESRSCSQGSPSPASPDPKACNWKKYKFIVLNSQTSQAGSLVGESSGQPCPQARLPSGDEACSSSSSSEEGTTPGLQSRLSLATTTARFKCGALANNSYLFTPRAQETSLPASKQANPPPGSEFFSCQNCEAVAGCSSGLELLAPGDEDKPYKCQLCRSAFRYKGNLASHRTVHTGEKPYRCSICGARFNRPANLKTHSRIHSGEKPYKCETCGSRFVQVAHLRAHVLIHTGEKPYPCPTCGTRFRHLQTLKSHVRIHTGEKPYHASSTLVVLAVAYGFTSGALTPVAFSVLPELVGTGRIYCGMGLVQMIESIGGLLGAPLSGYLRDVTGNYTASFVVAGAFLLAGSGVLLTLPHFFSCISVSTSRPQDLVIEASDTKIPLPKEEGLGEN